MGGVVVEQNIETAVGTDVGRHRLVDPGPGAAAGCPVCAEEVAEKAPAVETGKTHVLLAVDRSGSMSRLVAETRAGYNAFLDDLSGDVNADRVLVTTVLFDHEVLPLCTAAAVGVAPRLNEANYTARGYTALYDAVGKLIVGFEAATALGEHDRVMLVVQTDGQENASQEFRAERIRAMVAEREKSGKWTTAYLGAGPDAWDGGEAIGMASVNTRGDAGSTLNSYAGITHATRGYAGGASAAATFGTLSGIAAGGVPDGSGDGSA